ncbi:OmpH family outer membrane protein [Winogradskyella sp. UBA3174]|uniref:OmpH family outer membrane protein n=1 Tax=Winogradskyella sp. UBA3174 TaxID=1947785 RepID=UPI0025FAFBCB|nr:OmpH family outer membrane protein [Winogradskyella sp. UBA3174]|tara:strand:+ start:41044 stop:41607 length:564 start_codon:yes stop_codon:yes gene_type:complete
MKRIIIAMVVLLAFSSCQEQQKIAFVDNGKVINDYQMKIDIETRFKKKDEAYTRKTDSVGQSYQIDAQQTQMRLSQLSQDKQQEGSQEFSQKWQGIQQQLQLEQQQMQQSFNQEMDSVIVKVKAFVGEYGKAKGYTYILGKNEAGSVLYGSASNDISEEVAKAINEAYNVKSTEKVVATEEKEVSEK